jgi:hypothetical protein
MMTDEELTLAAEERFLEFDRREAADERAHQYRDWALSVFCWDGVLPFAVVMAPIITKLLLPGNEAVLAFVGISGAIGAFSFRFVVGYLRMHSRPTYLFQNLAFVVAICVLFLFETIWAVDNFGKGPRITTWAGLLYMYGCYLVLMAIALFPTRPRYRAKTWAEGW